MFCRHCQKEAIPTLFRCIMINGRTHVYEGCRDCHRQLNPIWLKQSTLPVPLIDIPIGKDNRGFANAPIN